MIDNPFHKVVHAVVVVGGYISLALFLPRIIFPALNKRESDISLTSEIASFLAFILWFRSMIRFERKTYGHSLPLTIVLIIGLTLRHLVLITVTYLPDGIM